MVAYDIPAPAGTCAATGRELQPGDPFVAVLSEEAGGFVRADYAADAWPGPPENSVAYWRGRIPATSKMGKPTIDEGSLFACFDQLAGATEPARQNFRYILALLLMRRKKLKFEDASKTLEGRSAMILRDTRTGKRVEVIDPQLNEAEIDAAQSEVFRALGW